MSRNHSTFDPMGQVNIIGKLADLKDEHYRSTLALSAIIELLVEKGILTESEIRAKASALDALTPLPTDPSR